MRYSHVVMAITHIQRMGVKLVKCPPLQVLVPTVNAVRIAMPLYVGKASI